MEHKGSTMSSYKGIDFYNIESHLTEEEIMVRDLVRDWVSDRVLPIIDEHYMACLLYTSDAADE